MSVELVNRWRTRVARAADLILKRLDSPPSLKELAAAAAVSPFHFHRIWRALTGETVGQTVLRLRLEASKELLHSQNISVAETALAVGFGTPQSFARAFRQHTGTTPTQHRAAGLPMTSASSSLLTVDVQQRGHVLVVALRREGRPYTNLNATFGEIWSWAESVDAIKDLEGIYGIPLDDPMSVDTDCLRYDACLALGVSAAPQPFHSFTLPAGHYARLRHIGPYDGLEAATQALVGFWLPASGWQAADFPTMHQFINDPDTTPAKDLVTDILLPLRSYPPE